MRDIEFNLQEGKKNSVNYKSKYLERGFFTTGGFPLHQNTYLHRALGIP